MSLHDLKSKCVWSLCAVILIAACALAFVYPKRGTGEQQNAKRSTQLPPVISKIKTLEVVGAHIEGEGEPGTAVVVEIRNNSDKAVTGVALEQGDDKDAYGVSTDGYRVDEPPIVIIEPHGSVSIKMETANLWPDLPIRVAGVIYADDTEEGEKATLGTMRRQHARDKANHDAKKGGPQ
jgi:hypothetical protein